MRSYGYRPITKELRRRGVIINSKVVLRLLREDNLLCLRRRAFVSTTDSKHHFTVYPNLARDLVLTDINQLWVADITYIRLRRDSFIWPPCSTLTVVVALAGPWRVISMRACLWPPYRWLCKRVPSVLVN